MFKGDDRLLLPRIMAFMNGLKGDRSLSKRGCVCVRVCVCVCIYVVAAVLK